MNKKGLYQFVKFGIVGTSNTLIAYAVYSICVFVGIHYIVANAIAFLVSVLNAYFWSDRYIFKKEEGETRNVKMTILRTYIAYGSTGLILGSILLTIYVDIFMISEYIAQLFVLIFTIPLNFIINKFWSFKTKKENEENKCLDSLL